MVIYDLHSAVHSSTLESMGVIHYANLVME